MQSGAVTERREIRVFVSSTFRDMFQEREELLKQVFPQIRQLCEQRGITWGEVDLRWGITEEAAAEGDILPICLAEIDRCRPYFVGILGERYGWIAESIPPQVLSDYPWLAYGISVTEAEILNGVFQSAGEKPRAFFYFRDSAYAARLPEGTDITPFRAENAETERKQADLKQRIRQECQRQGFVLHENYSDLEQFTQLVLKDFTDLIEREFPMVVGSDPLDLIATAHQATLQRLCQFYIPNEQYFNAINAYINSPVQQPLVVLGESGLGKSALLANWFGRRVPKPAIEPVQPIPQQTPPTPEPPGPRDFFQRLFRRSKPEPMPPMPARAEPVSKVETPKKAEPFALIHFVGADLETANWRLMLRRLLGELKRHYNFTASIPNHDDLLPGTFLDFLNMGAVQSPILLVVDMLNGLDNDLIWLPDSLPPNVKILVSTLPGPIADQLKERDAPILQIEGLLAEARSALLKGYLAQYGKTLDDRQSHRILASPATANPLFLRLVLDELHVFGSFERLEAIIDYYLVADNVQSLLQLMLQRFETDYGAYPTGIGWRNIFSFVGSTKWSERSRTAGLARFGSATASQLHMVSILPCEYKFADQIPGANHVWS